MAEERVLTAEESDAEFEQSSDSKVLTAEESEREFDAAALEADPSLVDPIDIKGALDRKTWTDAFRDFSKAPYQYVPFVNMVDVVTAGRMMHLAGKIQSGSATPKEDAFYNHWLADQQRKTSFGFKVMDSILRMPSYAVEFATTGGIVRGGAMLLKWGSKKAAIELAKGTIKGSEAFGMRMMSRFMGKKAAGAPSEGYIRDLLSENVELQLGRAGQNWFMAARNVLAHPTDGAARSIMEAARGEATHQFGRVMARAPIAGVIQTASPLLMDQVAAATIRSMTPTYALTPDEQGKIHRVLVADGDGFAPAFARAFGDTAVENWSEQIGSSLVMLKGMFGAGAESALKAAAIGKGLQKAAEAIQKKTGVPIGAAFVMAKRMMLGEPGKEGFMQRAGWNGWFAEMGEEMVGATAKSALGIQPWSAFPDLEEIAAMGVAFAFNPLALHDLAKDQVVGIAYRKDFETLGEVVKSYNEGPELKTADGIVLDFFRTQDQANPVNAYLKKLVGYHAKEQAEAGLGIWERFKRKIWLDVANRKLSDQFLQGIGANAFDNILERTAKAGVNLDNVDVANNLLEDLTGRAIVPNGSDLTEVARVAAAVPQQVRDGKIVGTKHGGKLPAGRLLLNVGDEADSVLTPEQFKVMRDAHPYAWAVTSATTEQITPLKTISNVSHDEDSILLNGPINVDLIKPSTLRYYSNLLGIRMLDIHRDPRTGVNISPVQNEEETIQKLQMRAEFVNGLARRLPPGQSVHLDGGRVIVDTRQNLNDKLGYDHPDLANLKPGEKGFMIEKAASSLSGDIHLSNSFRDLDVAEEVMHGLTLYINELGKSAVDPYFTKMIELFRKQIKANKSMIGYDGLSDKELLAKALVTRLLGHRSENLSDFTRALDENLRLDVGSTNVPGEKREAGQAEIELATEIYAYLKHRALQMGYRDDVIDFVASHNARYHRTGEDFKQKGFIPQEDFSVLKTLILTHNRAPGDPDVVIPDDSALMPDYQQASRNMIAKIQGTNGLKHVDFIKEQINESGEAARPLLYRFFKRLYLGHELINDQLPDILTATQTEEHKKIRAEEAGEKAKPAKKVASKGQSSQKPAAPVISGFDDFKAAFLGTPETPAGATDVEGEWGPAIIEPVNIVGQGDPGKPNIGNDKASKLTGQSTKKVEDLPPSNDPFDLDFLNKNYSLESDNPSDYIEPADINDGFEGFEIGDPDEGINVESASNAEASKPFGGTETEAELMRRSQKVNIMLVDAATRRSYLTKDGKPQKPLREAGYMWMDLTAHGVSLETGFHGEDHQLHSAKLINRIVEEYRAGPPEPVLPESPTPEQQAAYDLAVKRRPDVLKLVKQRVELIDATLKNWKDLFFPHGEYVDIGEDEKTYVKGGNIRYDKASKNDYRPASIYEVDVSSPPRSHNRQIMGSQYFIRPMMGKRQPAVAAASHMLRRIQDAKYPWRMVVGARTQNPNYGQDGGAPDWRAVPTDRINGETLREIRAFEMSRKGGIYDHGFWMFASRNADKTRMYQIFVKDLAGAELQEFRRRYRKFYESVSAEERVMLKAPDELEISTEVRSNMREITEYLRRWDLMIKTVGTGGWWIKQKGEGGLIALSNFANLSKRKGKLDTPGLRFMEDFDYVVWEDELDALGPLADGAMFYTKDTLGEKLDHVFASRGWYRKDRSFIAKGFMVYNNSLNADADIGHNGDLIQVKPGMFDIEELLGNSPPDSKRYLAFQAIKRIITQKNAVVITASAVKANGGLVDGKPYLNGHRFFTDRAAFYAGEMTPDALSSALVYKFEGSKSGADGHVMYVTADPNHDNEQEYEQILKQLFHVRLSLPDEYLSSIMAIEEEIQKVYGPRSIPVGLNKALLDVLNTEPGDYNLRTYGQFQSMLKNGAVHDDLIDGYDRKLVMRILASLAYRAMRISYPKSAVYALPIPEGNRKELRLDPASNVFVAQGVDANLPGTYSEDSPVFKTVKAAEEYLQSEPGAVFSWPWMFMIDVKTRKISNVVRREKIIRNREGGFVFSGQPVIDLRVPLSNSNLATISQLSERISSKAGETQPDPNDPKKTIPVPHINGIIESESARRLSGLDYDLDLMHQMSLMPQEPGKDGKLTYAIDDSLPGIINLSVLIWSQGMEVNARMTAAQNNVVNLKDKVLQAYVTKVRKAALADKGFDPRRHLNPYHFQGMVRQTDGSSGAKKALGIFASNSAFMRFSDKLGITGSYENFTTSTGKLSIVNRKDLGNMTPEEIMLRDHIWIDYLIQMAVDDEKDPILQWLGITNNTAPLLLGIAFGSPVFEATESGRDKGMKYLTRAFEFLNSDAVREYNKIQNDQIFSNGRIKNFMESSADTKASVEMSMRIWAGFYKEKKERTEQDLKRIHDVDAIYKLLRLGGGLNMMRAMINEGFSPLGTPSAALASQERWRLVSENAIPGLDLSKMVLKSDSTIAVPAIRTIRNITQAQQKFWEHDIVFHPEFVKAMRKYEALGGQEAVPGSFNWNSRVENRRRSLVKDIHMEAASTMLGQSAQTWLEEGVPADLREALQLHSENEFVKAIRAGEPDQRSGLVAVMGDDRYLEADDARYPVLVKALSELPEGTQRLLGIYLVSQYADDERTSFGGWKHIQMATPYFVEFNKEFADARNLAEDKVMAGQDKQINFETGALEAPPEAPDALPGTVTVLTPKSSLPQAVQEKERAKFTIPAGATWYLIAEADDPKSSTASYMQQAGSHLVDELTGVTFGPGDIVLTSTEGARKARFNPVENQQLVGPYSRILEALDAGAIVRTDTDPTSYNIGERAIRKVLIAAGYVETNKGAYSEWRSATAPAVTPPAAPADSLPESTANTFVIVDRSEPHDVSAMRANGGKSSMANTRPGQPGWLGNPYKWSGNGGSGTREEATEKFRAAFLEKVGSDLVFRNAVLSLLGKRVGYHQGDVEGSHVKIIQQWRANQGQAAPAPAVTPPAPLVEQAPTLAPDTSLSPLPPGGQVFDFDQKIDELLKPHLISSKIPGLDRLQDPVFLRNGEVSPHHKLVLVPAGRETHVVMTWPESEPKSFDDIRDDPNLISALRPADINRMGHIEAAVDMIKGNAAREFRETLLPVKPLPSVIVDDEIIFSNGTTGKLNDHADSDKGQKNAVNAMVKIGDEAMSGRKPNRSILVDGPPGSGKTTIVREFLRRMRLKHGLNSDILMATPTHAATGVMRSVTSWWSKRFGKPGSAAILQFADAETVTKALGGSVYRAKPRRQIPDGLSTQPGRKPYLDKFVRAQPGESLMFGYPTVEASTKTQFKPAIADAKLVIIDEISMLDDFELEILYEYQKHYGFGIIFLGDRAQLAQVRAQKNDVTTGPGYDYPDIGKIFLQENLPHYSLVQVMRQKSGNPLMSILEEQRKMIFSKKEVASRYLPPNEQIMNGNEGYLAMNRSGLGMILRGTLSNKMYVDNPNALRIFTPTNDAATEWNILIYGLLFPGSKRQLEKDTLLRAHGDWKMDSKPKPWERFLAQSLGLVSYHNGQGFMTSWVGSTKQFDVRLPGQIIGGHSADTLLEPFRKLYGRNFNAELTQNGMPASGFKTHQFFMLDPGSESFFKAAMDELGDTISAAEGEEIHELSSLRDMLQASILNFSTIRKTEYEIRRDGQRKMMDYGYASTAHKGQGSQALVAIYDFTKRGKAGLHSFLQNMYVGMSRSEKVTIALHSEKFGNVVPSEFVENVRDVLKNSGIRLMIPEFVENIDDYGRLNTSSAKRQKIMNLEQTDPKFESSDKSGFSHHYSWRGHKFVANNNADGEITYVAPNDKSSAEANALVPALRSWLRRNPPPGRSLSAEALDNMEEQQKPKATSKIFLPPDPEKDAIDLERSGQAYSLEVLEDYVNMDSAPGVDPAKALHHGFVDIRNKFKTATNIGRNYPDRINRKLGFDKSVGVYWGEAEKDGTIHVYDSEKVDDNDDPVSLASFSNLEAAKDWVIAENRARRKDGRIKKPSKEALAVQERVLSAMTAVREGSDEVVTGVELRKSDGKPMKAVNLVEVDAKGRRRVIKQFKYDMPNKSDVEVQDEAKAEADALRANGRLIEQNNQGTLVTFEEVSKIMDDYKKIYANAQERFNDAIKLYESSMRHREKINTDMRSIVGDNWLHYWSGTDAAYVPHSYIKEEEAGEAAKIRAHFGRRESTHRIEPRKYDSYLLAAMQEGLMPVTMRADTLISSWYNDVWSNAVTKTAVAMGMTMVDGDGAPLWVPEFMSDSNLDIKKMRLMVSDFVLRQSYENLLGYINLLRYQTGNTPKDKAPIEPIKGLPDEVTNDDAALKKLVVAYRDLLSENKALLHKAGYVTPVGNLLGDNSFKNVESFKVRQEARPGSRTGSASVQERILMHLIQPEYTLKPFGNMDILKGLGRFNNWSKHLGLSLSLFHPVSLFESFLGSRGVFRDGWETAFWPPTLVKHIRAMGNLSRRTRSTNKMMEKWVEAGMSFDMTNPNYDDSQLHKDALWVKETFPLMSPVINAWENLSKKNNKWLWATVLPSLKLYIAEETHRELSENYKERGINFNDRELRTQLATYTNDILGGQNWDQYTWATPRNKQLLHLLWFAPDWTLSALNSAMGYKAPFLRDVLGYQPGAVHEDLLVKKYWPAMFAIVMTSIPAVMQSMIFALSKAIPGPEDEDDVIIPMLNEAGKSGMLGTGIAGSIDLTPLLRKFGWLPGIGYDGGDTGKRRVYLRWAKQATEVFEGWLTEPMTTFFNKQSASTRAVFEQITGSNSMGELGFKHEPFFLGIFKGEEGFTDSRLGYLGQKFVPMSIMSALQGRPTTFFAPSSRGISAYVAQTQLAKLITAYGENDVWSTLVGSKEHPVDLAGLGLDILDAAERNGLVPDVQLTSARRKVLAHFYKDFFNKINDQDWKGVEKTARIITRINSGVEDVLRSMGARYKAIGRPLPEESATRVREVFQHLDEQNTRDQEFQDLISQ